MHGAFEEVGRASQEGSEGSVADDDPPLPSYASCRSGSRSPWQPLAMAPTHQGGRSESTCPPFLALLKVSLISLILLLSLIHLPPTGAADSPGVNYTAENGTIFVQNLTTGEVRPLYLHGVSWFGFELKDHVVYGLNERNWKGILDDVKRLGFNAIRLPFCSESIRPGTKPTPGRINYALNPDLRNLTSLKIMEKIVSYANTIGLYVLLDYHRIGCTEIEPLWYTENYTEDQYIKDWLFLARTFGKYPNVIGADLKNEPHGPAGWGTGDKRDFRLFAERAGGEILKVAPHWLIFVEGTQYTHVPRIDSEIEKNGWWTFWGENLMGVREYPVRLPKGKVVYSPHVYGPSVYMMDYFKSPDFPANMPAIWNAHFGYLTDLNYTIAIGEWGGTYRGLDKVWQDSFVQWLLGKRIYNFFYWCLNPESGDTGGIFLDDWKTVNWEKMRLIYRLIKASDPKFEEPLYIILESNATTSVLGAGEKVRIYWYTSGDVVDSNFARSREGEMNLTLNRSITFYIVARKGNRTLRKELKLYVIEGNTGGKASVTSSPTSSAPETPPGGGKPRSHRSLAGYLIAALIASVFLVYLLPLRRGR
ncbi:glycoside hydrolase family 5 protein [Thermococcus sp.]|uniref:glycoside hydrolase family 5 protein n=2 Tax=Thermococcus sp. TaxID=35749 RepID=UPI0026019041|nr:glycoside hydrolase family 5 protein [Thermococcus sp.]